MSKFSVVVPCYNEEEGLERFATELFLRAEACKSLELFEVLFVDDGSTDQTWLLIEGLIESSGGQVKGLQLTRNFGHQAALVAGLERVEGDLIGIIDADLQDPPDILFSMLDVLVEDTAIDCVYGQRTYRDGETFFKLKTATTFYKILNLLSETDIQKDTGDFRVMNRRVLDCVLAMGDYHIFTRGMVAWVGFNQVAFKYKREARAHGATKYTITKMARLARSGIFGFSLIPLHIISIAGLLITGASIIGIVYALLAKFFFETALPGWTLLFISNLFIGGALFFSIGLLGQYIGLIFEQVKNRPKYLIKNEK